MGAWWQKQYFPPVKADYFQTQTWQTHWYIFLLIKTTALVKYLIFLKETDLLPLVARKSSGSTVSLIRCWLPCLLLPWLCETVISDDFPAWSGKQPVSFRKLKYLTKLFIVTKMNQGFSYSFEAVTIHPSRGENPFFAIRPQYPGSQKHSPLKFQSCVKTVLGHTASLHEKRVQEKVFCECWLPMIRWNCTVRDWQASSLFLTDNSDIWQTCCCNKEKNETSVFFWQCEAANIQLSLEKITVLSLNHNSQVHKNMFTSGFRLCKDTPRTHSTIPWEKRSRRGVLWVLNAMFVVTQIRWNCTLRWLPRMKWQAAVFVECKCLTKAVIVMRRKGNQCAFSGRFEDATVTFSWLKILLLPSGPNFKVHKSMFPCQFRAG